MTPRIELEDLDPDAADIDADADPIGQNQDLAIRMARKLRFARTELAELEALYTREKERLEEARERACGSLRRSTESMDRWLANWWLWEYGQRCAVAPDPSKVRRSLPLPDGEISVRRSSKIVADPGAEQSIPPHLTRSKVEVDKTAIAAAIKAGELAVIEDGSVVTLDGELLPVRVVEEDVPTVKIDGVVA